MFFELFLNFFAFGIWGLWIRNSYGERTPYEFWIDAVDLSVSWPQEQKKGGTSSALFFCWVGLNHFHEFFIDFSFETSGSSEHLGFTVVATLH